MDSIKVLEYMEKYLFEPGYSWPIHIFDERSYSRWAACEIVERLMNRPYDPADEVIEEFIFELSAYVYASTDDTSKRCQMFSIAKNAAEDILNYILKGDVTHG